MIEFILLVMVSGFAVSLVSGWGPAYQWNLFFHPISGLLVSVLFLNSFRKKLHAAPRTAVLFLFTVPSGLAILLPFVYRLFLDLRSFHFCASVIAVFMILGHNRLKASPSWGGTFSRLDFFGLLSWNLLLCSGTGILLFSQGGGAKSLFYNHLVCAAAFTVIFLIRIGLPFAHRFARDSNRAASGPIPKRSLGSTLLALLLLGAVVGVDRADEDPSFTIALSTIPLEHRRPENKQVFFSDERFDPVGMDLTQSCTKAEGCHGQIEQGFLNSNHNISLMTPHFQKNLDSLTEEIGFENTLICAGCHTPYALFDQSKDYRYFKDHNNFSCSFCHIIGSVDVPRDDPRRSSYTLNPPAGHLRLFIQDGQEALPDKWTARLIRLSPLNHGRRFSRPLYKEDAFCVVCHHHQIPLPPAEGLARPLCISCHMQPQRDLGMEGDLANHFMPGANMAVPHFAGREAASNLISKWISGEYQLKLSGWENFWEPRYDREDQPQRATWLYMLLESITEPVLGREYTFRILTTNAGMEHAFPAAPLDLIEAWLELRVLDQEGNVLYESGITRDLEPVAPGARTMGGYMIGEDEQIVTKNRVWQIKKKVVQRTIEPGRQTTDTFTLTLPSYAKGPLHIQAHWRYRKLNQEFLLWAYGPDVAGPVLTVGGLEVQVDLHDTPGGPHNPEPGPPK